MARPSLGWRVMRLPLEPPMQDPLEESEDDGVALRVVPDPDESSTEGRVPSWRLKTLIDRIQSSLSLSERQVIHRYLANQVGISTRSVLRYDKGDVATTPTLLVEAARNVLERIRMGRPVIFLRGREKRPVVVRKQLVDLVDRIVRSGLYPERFEIFKLAEDKLELRSGRVARLYRSTDVQLIDQSIYDCVASLATKARYDPRAEYNEGDRVRHPVFGVGTVTKKMRKQKIQVTFVDGSERILREQLEEDPIRRRLCGSFDVSEHHVLALHRH
jgi:hypothetical protein